MNLAIFFLPVVLTAAHYIVADIRNPQKPCLDSDCR
jgi:hypothetical protein